MDVTIVNVWRKGMFLLGVPALTVASALCGLAPAAKIVRGVVNPAMAQG